MPYPSLQIADAFITRALNEGKELSNLKLQKLLFLANGIHLVASELKQPLCDEPIAAWPYGPVLPNVYHAFKRYGNLNITTPSLEAQLGLYKTPLSPDAETSINTAWEIGKDINAVQLSNWSHNIGSPWYKATQEQKAIIPNEYITDFFKPLVKK